MAFKFPWEPDEPHYVKPRSAAVESGNEFLESNQRVIYPAIAVVVLLVVAIAILQAWRSNDLDGVQKAELKREIIRELRKEVHGITADRLEKATGTKSFKLLKVLEEMQAEGILETRTDTRRITTWRLKGLA